MQQAIDEGFILDVLKNYTTYHSYYKIAKIIEDDPKMDKSQGAKAIAKFATLHPTNIAQKTQIMIEHFRNSTKKKIGGKAKAMRQDCTHLGIFLNLKTILPKINITTLMYWLHFPGV